MAVGCGAEALDMRALYLAQEIVRSLPDDLPMPALSSPFPFKDHRPAALCLLEAEPPEQEIEGQLHADIEVAEVGVAGGDLVEAHFIDDGFDVAGVLG